MQLSTLGISPALIAAGASLASQYGNKSGSRNTAGGDTSAPGIDPATGQPFSPEGPVISPAFQQSFRAQVSPTIIAQIGSEGATATGAPSMQTSGGQNARGGGRSAPGLPGLPGVPDLPPDAGYPSPFADPFASPILQSQQNYTPIITTGIIAAAAITGLILYNRSKRR